MIMERTFFLNKVSFSFMVNRYLHSTYFHLWHLYIDKICLLYPSSTSYPFYAITIHQNC